MTEQITLNLPDNLAQQVRQAAALSQRQLEDVLLEWLDRGSLESQNQPSPEQAEAELLRQVNMGFSADWWAIYRRLILERQAEVISEIDLVRLIEMSEALEAANVQRIEALAKLADIRSCPIERVMESLGIRPTIWSASAPKG
jgi:plasmid stability protein